MQTMQQKQKNAREFTRFQLQLHQADDSMKLTEHSVAGCQLLESARSDQSVSDRTWRVPWSRRLQGRALLRAGNEQQCHTLRKYLQTAHLRYSRQHTSTKAHSV